MRKTFERFAAAKNDLPASLVVALVALPLCLGIAMASGAPLFSGIIAGMVGGIVVGLMSRSPLSVSGPAAGLTVMVLNAIEALPGFPVFLLAVVLAGVFQIAFAFTRAGVLSEFVPSSVISGMLAAIGLILILKQIPHAVGFDGEFEGLLDFKTADGRNTFERLADCLTSGVMPGAVVIAAVSLAFLFWWEGARPISGPLRFLPGPLVVVLIGVLGNLLFGMVQPEWQLASSHLVQVPVVDSLADFPALFTLPDFSAWSMAAVWTTALMLAIVASLESLLSVKAVDEIDPQRRVTEKNWELLAQGSGNMVSGLLGGLPLTSVIVRSSANVNAGASSKLSTILHGVWLLVSVALVPTVLNLIPLSALAAVLIATGYKLTRPALFKARYAQGWGQFLPFVATVVAILLTGLLQGLLIGMAIGLAFVVLRNFRHAITFVAEDGQCILRARRNLDFIHKYELQTKLNKTPDNSHVLIDLSSINYVDLDNVEIINAFIETARRRQISVVIRGDIARKIAPRIHAPATEVQYS